MLSKVKTALRTVTTDSGLVQEILDLIASAIADLETTGAYLTDKYSEVKTGNVITDYTVSDSLLSMAIITYCRMHYGQPDDYDRLKASYDEQKAQLRMNSNYEETING